LKLFLVAVGSWVSGLATFVICTGGPAGMFRGFTGILAVISLVAATPTIGVLFLPTMFWLRSRTPTAALGTYVAAGLAVGLIPGLVTALIAGSVQYIDSSPRGPLELVTSTSGLAGLAAGVVSGVACGAGFYAGIARRTA